MVREHLTASNVPCCQCCICLYGFRDGDHFTKTHCYHYFHSHCLAGHLTASERIFREEQDKLPAWQQTEKFQVIPSNFLLIFKINNSFILFVCFFPFRTLKFYQLSLFNEPTFLIIQTSMKKFDYEVQVECTPRL